MPTLARRALAAACLLAAAWVGAGLAPADLRFRPSVGGEVVVVVLLLALVGLAGGIEPVLAARLPRLEARLHTIPRWFLPVAGFTVWAIAWAVVLHLRDPGWYASGIDWHDAYLLAYALRDDDAAFSTAARYPLYPALGAWLSGAVGLPLDVALQVVSRASGVLVVIPLAAITVRLFGRAAAATGAVLLLAIGSFQHHIDATTPYPFYMLCVVVTLTGLVCGWDGRLRWFGAVGLGLGAAMATDSKALALLLVVAPFATLAALFAPTGRAWGAAIGLRALRVLALLAPLWGSYQWMASLPYTPLSLETVAAPTLFPPTWTHSDYAAYSRAGYVWGHFTRVDQIPYTVGVFREMGARSEQQEARVRRAEGTASKLRLEYPVGTATPVWVGLAALVVPVLRRWRRPGAPVLQVGAVLAIGVTILPTLVDDYQDRYVLHALVLLPFLVGGAADTLARLVIDGRTQIGRHLRLLVLGSTTVFALTWPGFPHALGNVLPRLGPISSGGVVEREVATWAHEQMDPTDVLLDLTWMMNGCLAAGDRTVVRLPSSYPAAGVPTAPWRGSRPHLPTVGAIYALVSGGEPPMGRQAIASDEVRTSAEWSKVWTSSDGYSDVYRFVGAGVPSAWGYDPSPRGSNPASSGATPQPGPARPVGPAVPPPPR